MAGRGLISTLSPLQDTAGQPKRDCYGTVIEEANASFGESEELQDWDAGSHRVLVEECGSESDRISNIEAALSLVAAVVGTGVLFMPHAFATLGLVPAIISTTIMGAIAVYTISLLINATQLFRERHNLPSCDYSETMMFAFEESATLKRFSHVGKTTVASLILVGCFPGQMVYLIMISKSIIAIFEIFNLGHLTLRAAIACVIPIFVALQCITKVKNLTFITSTGIMCTWTGLIITTSRIVGAIAEKGVNNMEAVGTFNSPTAFATIIYAFSAITSISPIENSMRVQKSFVGSVSVNSVVMSGICIIYNVFGTLGYMAFGDTTMGPITTNMTQKDLMSTIIQLCVPIGLIFQSPIGLFSPYEIICNHIIKRSMTSNKFLLIYVPRILLSLMIMSIPIIFPNIAAMLNMTSVCLTILQFIFPVVIDWLTFQKTRTGLTAVVSLTTNIFVLTLGFVFTFVLFYQSSVELINSY